MRAHALGFAYWTADGRLTSDGTPDAEFDFRVAVELNAIQERQQAREAEERRFKVQSIIGANEARLAAARPLRAQVQREIAEALRPKRTLKDVQDEMTRATYARLLDEVDRMPGMQRREN